MINKALRVEARIKGIRLTVDRNGKRVQKREPVLRKEIRDHENGIIRTRARQTKDMLYMCKSVLSILNKNKIITEMKSGDYENLVLVFDKYFGDYVILER